MDYIPLLLVILLWNRLLLGNRVQCTRSISKDENREAETQLQTSNKSEFNNIQNSSEPIYNIVSAQEYKHIDSKVGLSPVGIIPTGIIAKGDLMGERHILDSKKIGIMNDPHTFLAIARTKVGAGKYTGGGGSICLYNPKVVGQQFSAARIRLQAGSESIEVGWRVDPALYGDSQTHLFIRTDAGQSHCFNTQCPGYIHTDPNFPIDSAFDTTSRPGKLLLDIPCYIERDKNNGNWNLLAGKDLELIGHWPSNIFKTGLVDRIEFGGAVYSPPGTPLPPMGSSNFPIGNYEFDAYIRNMKVLNEGGESIDTFDLELYTDNSNLYSVYDAGIQSEYLGRMIYYGGPAHPS